MSFLARKFKLIFKSHFSKSSYFVQKFNFDFPRKLSISLGEKLVKMLGFWTTVDNFNFTRKIAKKKFGRKTREN